MVRPIQNSRTATEKMVPKTLKAVESKSPKVVVEIAKNPIGKVKPHQPILKGKLP